MKLESLDRGSNWRTRRCGLSGVHNPGLFRRRLDVNGPLRGKPSILFLCIPNNPKQVIVMNDPTSNPRRDKSVATSGPIISPPFSAPEIKQMRDQWKEYRRFRRKSVILASKLETAHGVFDCVALDLSLGGARLRLDGPVQILEPVTLVLSKFGRFPSEIVWRNATEAGLQFSEPPEEIAGRFGSTIPFEEKSKLIG